MRRSVLIALCAAIDLAIGVGTVLRHHFNWFRPLGIRGDFALMNYGNERQRVPLSSTVNRVIVEMNTSNNILLVGGGPELAVMRGPVRPYAHGFVGYSRFFTESSAGDDTAAATSPGRRTSATAGLPPARAPAFVCPYARNERRSPSMRARGICATASGAISAGVTSRISPTARSRSLHA